MNEKYQDGYEDNPEIVVGSVVPDDATSASSDPIALSRWEHFKGFLFPRLRTGEGIGLRFLQGKSKGEEAKARKIVEEANDLAAKRKVVEQEEFGAWLDNLERVLKLENPIAQKLAFARMIQADPELLEQVRKIDGVAEKLMHSHGTLLDFQVGSPDEFAQSKIVGESEPSDDL